MGSDCQTLNALKAVLKALRGLDGNIGGHRDESIASFNGIKESLDRCREILRRREYKKAV